MRFSQIILAFAAFTFAAFIPDTTEIMLTASDTSFRKTMMRGPKVAPSEQFSIIVKGTGKGVFFTIGGTNCTASRTAQAKSNASVFYPIGGPYFRGRPQFANDTGAVCLAAISADTTKKDTVYIERGAGAQ